MIEHLLPEAADCSASNPERCASFRYRRRDESLVAGNSSMTPRTDASSRASSKALRKSNQVDVFSALRTFGRLTVT
jgi:hypothetical protein